ncbi:MAG: hypothetical protein RRY20_00795 [Bilophila sp.]
MTYSLEGWLWRRGIRDETLRKILRGQLVITLLTLGLGALLWLWFEPVGRWLFWFGTGSALSAWNFYFLIKYIQRIIQAGWSKSALVGLLIHTNLRLLFTGVLLYTAIVWCKAILSALIPGLTVLFAGILVVSLEKALKRSS